MSDLGGRGVVLNEDCPQQMQASVVERDLGWGTPAAHCWQKH